MGELSAARAALRDTLRENPPPTDPAPRPVGSGARLYVLTVLCAGCVILAISASELWVEHPPLQWWVLVALTLISGSAVLKIPSISANFSISDVFTLTSAVVFGPSAGTVIVAIDSLVISAFLTRRGLPLERILFNAAAPPVAMWLSAKVFFLASGFQPLYSHPLGLEVVGPWLLVFAALYFFLNTFAIAVAIALHERVNVVRIWRAHFQNLWLTFIGGALGAAFVVFALQRAAYGMVILLFPLLLAAILHFAYRNATGRVADRLHHLEELNRLNLSTIEALAHAIDAKDGVTHRHIRRVQSSAVALARRIKIDDDLQLRAIEAAALLHDIGKLAIPEHILNKPGKLTPDEFERIKSHSRVGAEILSEVDFPYPVVPIVRHHHENWDGTGYPDRLKGSEIPIGARILAVVDCFDALTSDRPYRRALTSREAFAIIDARRGTMYEPAIVDAFREMCASSPSPEAVSVDDQGETDAMPASAGRLTDQAASETGDGVRMAMALGAALSHDSSGRCPWRALADALCTLSDVDTAAVFVLDQTGTRLMPLRVTGRHAPAIERLSVPIGERMIGWVAAVGQPIVNGDAMLDLYDAEAKTLKSAVVIPCRGPHGGSAVVALYSTRTNPFSSVHRQLVETAVSLAAFREEPPQAAHQDRPTRRSVHRQSHRFPRAVTQVLDHSDELSD